MLASSDEVQAKSFHIFHDDKYIPLRTTRETSADTYSSSSRREYYYHGGACATVPFFWESQPGTPKQMLDHQTLLPPLTPPPSFFAPSAATLFSKNTKQSRNKFVFPNFSFIKGHRAIRLSTSPDTSLQSLSSSSPTVVPSPVTPLCDYYYCRRYGFQFEVEEEKNCFRSASSSYCYSSFMCFSSEKRNRRSSAARRSTGRCSCMFKRLIGISTA